jgi:hypothetical protein
MQWEVWQERSFPVHAGLQAAGADCCSQPALAWWSSARALDAQPPARIVIFLFIYTLNTHASHDALYVEHFFKRVATVFKLVYGNVLWDRREIAVHTAGICNFPLGQKFLRKTVACILIGLLLSHLHIKFLKGARGSVRINRCTWVYLVDVARREYLVPEFG